MSNFFAKGYDAISGLFGSNLTKDTNIAPRQSTANDKITNPRTTNDPELDAGGRILAGGTKKRPITLDSHDSEPRKKTDRRSAHERRLTGHYETPRDALPITIPQDTDEDAESHPLVKHMAAKPGGRPGIRPTNTLNRSPHAPVAQKKPPRESISRNFADKKGIPQPTNDRKSAESVYKGIVARPSTTLIGDGFEGRERLVDTKVHEPPEKRRKLEIVTPKIIPSSDPIDLTEIDEEIVESKVVALNGRRLPASSQESLSGPSVPFRKLDPFDNIEFQNADSLTRINKEKRRRKSKEGQGSSQASSRGTPAELANGHSSRSIHPTRHHETHDVTDQPRPHESQSNAKPKRADPRKLRPPIDLKNGFDTIKKPAVKGPSSEEDIEQSGQLFEMKPRPRQAAALGEQQRQSDIAPSQRRAIPQGSDGSFESYLPAKQKVRPVSPKLAPRFSRDEEVTHGPQQAHQPRQGKASARMQAESASVSTKVSPIGDSSGDELAGGNTIRSQTSRSVSPQKKVTARSRPQNRESHKTSKRSSSPGDLEPTQFKHRGRRTIEQSPDEDEPLKVPLFAFFATSCVLKSGAIELSYDEREGQFDLYCNNEIQVVSRKKCSVYISDTEAKKIFLNRESNKVYLAGSSGDISNGHICIAFRDPNDVRWFLARLYLATHDRITVEHLDISRLDKVFHHQSQGIAQKAEQDRLFLEKEQLANDKVRKLQSLQDNDDEEIKYEPFEPERPGARRNIWGEKIREIQLSARMSRQSGLQESSPYFTSQEPRRSTRQPKLVKPPSPSPPPLVRWTHENKLTRWTHSVVYPPEGVRRVTVDFEDLERLDEGELLNDNIISFALRRIEESMAPEHRDSVYFFNSFFYAALTSKAGRKSFNYDAVKRWTKNTDLLSFPFVVVPININYHWFVAIVCNLPSLSRKAAGLDDDIGEAQQDDTLDEALTTWAGDLAAAASEADPEPKEVQEPTEAMSQLSLSPEEERSRLTDLKEARSGKFDDSTNILDDDPDAGSRRSTGSKKSKKKPPPALRKYDPDNPTIITLDSLGGTHVTETRNLKDYLSAEADAKRGMALDTKDLQGMTAKGIPEQTNFCDCGLYLVGYVEQFAKDPRKFVTKVLTRELDKDADFATFDPSAKRAEIREQLLKLQADQEAERKVKKSAKKATGKVNGDSSAVEPPPEAAKTQRSLETKEQPLKEISEGLGRALSQPLDRVAIARENEPVAERIPANDGQEDIELELSVPRPLTDAAKNRTTDTNVSPPLERQTEAAHVEAEMLDNADQDLVYCVNGNDATDRSSTSLLGNLENALNNGPGALQNQDDHRPARDERDSPQDLGALSPEVQQQVRNTKAKHSQVIDLEAEDGGEPEVPDSQEPQVVVPRSKWTGTHMRFD